MNVDEEQLNSAPEFNHLADLSNHLYSETIYRFFGLQPQWTDEGQGPAAQGSRAEQPPQSGSQKQWQYQEQQRSQGQQQEKSGSRTVEKQVERA